jgi:hypothetical protein
MPVPIWPAPIIPMDFIDEDAKAVMFLNVFSLIS